MKFDRRTSPLFRCVAAAFHLPYAKYVQQVERRSINLLSTLDSRMATIGKAWFWTFLLVSTPRILSPASPIFDIGDFISILLPYLFIAIAPIAGYRIGVGSFPVGSARARLDFHLSCYGKWRPLSPIDAKKNPAFGPAGFMVALVIGLMINVVVRSFEFLVAVPAINGNAPAWSQMLFHLMAADVIVMSFFYMVCFVMALRTVPYFPRMLLFAWGLDITAQLIIAKQVGSLAQLPLPVATALQSLLEGNIQKVLISATLWLPYLILSDRVNVTYRQRIRN